MPVIIFRNMVTTTFPGVGNPSVEVALDGVTVQTVSASCVTNSVTYDVYRRPITQTDGRGNVTTCTYDALGRLASVTDAAGAVTAYAYDAAGRVAAVTNALGNVTVYDYDLRGNRTYEGGATYPVVYEYDAFGQKVSMTTFRDETSDDAGDTTTWAYDEATGALVSKTYADGRGVAYTLTDLGQVATRTDARGIVTTYAYNVYGDLVSQTYSDATPTVTYAYDALGRQAQATDAVGTTTFGYNAYGELETEAIAGLYAKTLTHHFDAYGRNVGYGVNGSRRTFLGYDGDTGRIAAMNEGGDFHWEYLPGSDLKARLTYPNGLTAEWAYEPERDLLTAVTNSLPNGTTLSAYVYTNDLLGRRTSKNDEQYGYNVRDELTSANERTYAYDDIGNRTTAEGRSYTANNLNQYTAIDGFVPTFDADGNQTKVLTETGEWTVEYNAENRPIRWTQGNKVITMGFDRMGRRVFYKEMEGNRQITHTVFLYDGYLCIQQLFSNSPWNVYKEFIWDPTEPLATRPLCFRQYGQRSAFLLHDGNKNVTDVVTVGPFNEPVAHYDYAPFGAVTATGARALANPFRFSSEFHDDTLALVYYNYRHYNPKDGRWLGRDPMEEEESIGLYCAVGNSPCTYFDLRGSVTVESIFLSSIEGGFSGDLIRLPIGPGFLVLTGLVEGTVYDCCNLETQKYETWAAGSGGFELFYELGKSVRAKEEKVKGNQRNERVPHPCRLGETIKKKDLAKAVEECNRKKPKKEKGGSGTWSTNTTRACPKKWWKIDSSLFVRGTIGAGFGGTFSISYQFETPKESFLENLNAQVSIGWVGAGASIEAGGRLTFTAAMKLHDVSCP